jgi:hypothetical protein
VTAFLVESNEGGKPKIRAAGKTALGSLKYRRQVKSSSDSGLPQTEKQMQPGSESDAGEGEPAPAPEEAPLSEESPPESTEEPPPQKESPPEKPPEQR